MAYTYSKQYKIGADFTSMQYHSDVDWLFENMGSPSQYSRYGKTLSLRWDYHTTKHDNNTKLFTVEYQFETPEDLALFVLTCG